MNSVINFLHLTDLHLGHGLDDIWTSRYRGLFYDDLESQLDSNPIDIVLFSGDLVNKGSEDEYKIFAEWLIDFKAKINLWGENPSFYYVPGNHDVDQNIRKRHDPIIDKLTANANREQNELWGNDKNTDYHNAIREVFVNYTRFADINFYNQPGLGIKQGWLPGDFSACFEKGDTKLGIIGLNSTFLQLGQQFPKSADVQNPAKGNLVINAKQLVEVCGGNVEGWIKSKHATLLMMHQPVDWLTPISQDVLHNEIAPAGRFVLHLCGHLHEARAQYILHKHAKYPRLFLQSCSLLGVRRTSLKTDRRHGYTIGAIELATNKVYDPSLRLKCRTIDPKDDNQAFFEEPLSPPLDRKYTVRVPYTKDTELQHKRKTEEIDYEADIKNYKDTYGTSRGMVIAMLNDASRYLAKRRLMEACGLFKASIDICDKKGFSEEKTDSLLGLSAAKLFEVKDQIECEKQFYGRALNVSATNHLVIESKEALDKAKAIMDDKKNNLKGYVRGTATYYKSCGDLALLCGRVEESKDLYNNAIDELKIASDSGFAIHLGLANTEMGLGNSYLWQEQPNWEKAKELYLGAGNNYLRQEILLPAKFGWADSVKSLGDTYRFQAENVTHLSDAKMFYQAALAIYVSIGRHYSVGLTYCALAGISSKNSERSAYLEMAGNNMFINHRDDLYTSIRELNTRR